MDIASRSIGVPKLSFETSAGELEIQSNQLSVIAGTARDNFNKPSH